jgi:hypothetical protein
MKGLLSALRTGVQSAMPNLAPLFVAALSIVPAAAFASDPDRQAVADACYRGSLANDVEIVDQAIAQITSWTGLVDPLTINVATLCLKVERPDQWTYSPKLQRFASADELARQEPNRRSGELCVEALQAGDQADLAFWRDFILSWRAPVATRTQTAALRCLNAMPDAPWTWDSAAGQFRPLADVAAEQARAEEVRVAAEAARIKAEAAQRAEFERQAALADQRRWNAIRRTEEACQKLLSRDETAALTNPVCSPIFLRDGLPD